MSYFLILFTQVGETFSLTVAQPLNTVNTNSFLTSAQVSHLPAFAYVHLLHVFWG